MTELTSAERRLLLLAISDFASAEEWDAGRSRFAIDRVIPVVEAILDARLADGGDCA